MDTRQQSELELEGEYEGEYEGEEFLGTIARGIGGLLGGQGEYEGEHEYEYEGEFEGEYEGEYEGEEFLGTIARGIGGLLGGQGEYEGEHEYEYEGEFEGEEFFRRALRGIGRFARTAAPVLRNVARVAAPIVGTAVGGPLGGMLGRVAASALREGEYEGEGEWEYEMEGEWEYEAQGEWESEYEMEAAAPITQQQALAEFMASVASRARTEAEAEAMVGAATVMGLSQADRAALRNILPHLVRGTAILTRILRRRRITRPAVRAVPAIVRGTTRTLVRRAAAGQPITRRAAARAMATQTRRVLSNPRTCAAALQRNVRATQAVGRTVGRPTGPARPAAGAGRRPAPQRRRPATG